MASDPILVRGIILKIEEYKDKDTIVTVFTRELASIRIVVKGSRSGHSASRALNIPFMVVDIVVTKSHGMLYLKDYSIVEGNSAILSSLEAMTFASHFAEVLIDCAITGVGQQELYELAIYTFFNLNKNTNSLEVMKSVYSAFNWRILVIHGQAPGEDILTNKYKLSGASVTALKHWSTSPINKLYRFSVDSFTNEQLLKFTNKMLSIEFDKNYNKYESFLVNMNLNG